MISNTMREDDVFENLLGEVASYENSDHVSQTEPTVQELRFSPLCPTVVYPNLISTRESLFMKG